MIQLTRIRAENLRLATPRLLLGASLAALGVGAQTATPVLAQTVAPEGVTSSSEEAVALDVIDVYGSGATTEGSGSYAADQAGMTRGVDSVKDVPQSVTVVTQQTIQDQNLTSLAQTMSRTPGIVVSKAGYGFPEFYSRGFIINNYQIDQLGTSYDSGFRPDFDMAIYDRLEVLRGAEALFSGAGEPGGTINLARKRPTESFQASTALSFGSWDDRRIEADVSGPLALDGRLRGRVIGVAQSREFFYSPSDEDKQVAYGILEYELTPTTVISGGASYQRQNGVTWQNGLPTFTDGSQLGLPRDVALTSDWSNREQTISEFFGSVEHGINADWTVKLSAMRQEFDFNYLNLNVAGPVDPVTGSFGPSTAGSERDGNTSNVVDANVAGKFQAWGREHGLVAGFDWRESYGSQLRYLVEPRILPGTLTIDDFPDPDLPEPEVGRLDYGWPEWGSRQQGAYARLDLAATDRMRVVLGGRYGDYHYTSTYEAYDEDGNVIDEETVGYVDSGVFAPYAGLTYAVTPDWTAYASLSEIYKPQANYLTGPFGEGEPLPPITGRNYEIGVKGGLMGGALSTSVALYRIERDGEAIADSRYPRAAGTAIPAATSRRER